MSMNSSLIPSLQLLCDKTDAWGVSAQTLADQLKLHRSHVSRQLARLAKLGKVERREGRPVLFRPASSNQLSLERLIGYDGSLQEAVEKAKAALLYPPHGLHTLLIGGTGVGKSLFVRLMHEYAVTSAGFSGQFVGFNCADYAHNPQLLLSQLFGSSKGAYTGAHHDRPGLLEQAHGGILFLDEIHRLPPEGQEMLFMYLDTGFYRRLGETEEMRKAKVFLAAATTELPESVLLKTFRRRIPMEIHLPLLADRPRSERLSFIRLFFKQEQERLKRNIWVEPLALQAILAYECTGNVGQLKRDIQLSCAHAYAEQQHADTINVLLSHLPMEVKKGTLQIRQLENIEEINLALETDPPDAFVEPPPDPPDAPSSLPAQTLAIHRSSTINQMVGNEIVNLVHALLDYASEKLGVNYPEQVYSALAMHIHGMTKRFPSQKYEQDDRLNELRKNHPDAFVVALESIPMLEKTLSREISIKEAGYLTLFFSYHELKHQLKQQKAAVVVICHGASTASSMLQTAQQLLGIPDGWAIDMPLDHSPELVYQKLKELSCKIDTSKGIIILADMGSALHVGSLLTEETGIWTETIANVSTLLVIDVLRKANLGQDLPSIIGSASTESAPALSIKKGGEYQRYVVVFNCTTGTGGAKQLEELVKKETALPEGIIFRSIAWNDWNSFVGELHGENRRIICVIGLWTPPIPVPLYFSPSGWFQQQQKQKLHMLLHSIGKRWAIFCKMKLALEEKMKAVDIPAAMDAFIDWLEDAEARSGEIISEESFAGILLHFCALVDLLQSGKDPGRKKQVKLDAYSPLAGHLNDTFPILEARLAIAIPNDEKVRLLSLFMKKEPVH